MPDQTTNQTTTEATPSLRKIGRPSSYPPGATEAEKKAILRERNRELKKKQDYDKAIASLPDRASAAAEIDWIRNHEAMTRLDRIADRTKATRIIITADDIAKAQHGPAPSRAAVNELQHWCNRPEDFYKMILTEKKKQSAGSQSEILGPETTQEIKDIDAILMALDGAILARSNGETA
jgi:hypothetical protein